MDSDKIPSWIVPASYLIIAGIMVLSITILSIIPYKKVLSVPITIYQVENDSDKENYMYGEILLANFYNLHIGDIVNVKIEAELEKHYYQANINEINYNQELNCYCVFVKFPTSENINAYLVFENTVQGDSEIIIKSSSLLYYLLNCIKDILL